MMEHTALRVTEEEPKASHPDESRELNLRDASPFHEGNAMKEARDHKL